tara:strand:+ start:1842 stop:2624 length:783 start_codon:yes stop_codon:yes gene_type:complete
LNAIILAAGIGTRLKPYTDIWPKALMPINGTPLLQIWIEKLFEADIQNILINTHHFANEVKNFIESDFFKKYKDRIHISFEENLLGTAGTIKKNINFCSSNKTLILHADNFSDLDIKTFKNAFDEGPDNCLIGMVTFETKTPSSCGIVEVDKFSVVKSFIEKPTSPLGTKANGAVYIFRKEALDFINNTPNVYDISLDVIPNYINMIFAWHHNGIFLDIGNEKNLISAQKLFPFNEHSSNWHKTFAKNQIHKMIANGLTV